MIFIQNIFYKSCVSLDWHTQVYCYGSTKASLYPLLFRALLAPLCRYILLLYLLSRRLLRLPQVLQALYSYFQKPLAVRLGLEDGALKALMESAFC